MGRTPQPALSKSPPVTPTVDQNNFARPEEISVSPDLSLDCSPDSRFVHSMCTNLSRSFILFSA
jgi:bloom syndrome protein